MPVNAQYDVALRKILSRRAPRVDFRNDDTVRFRRNAQLLAQLRCQVLYRDAA